MTLLETLRALAPVVTPGEWQAIGTDPAEGGDWFWIKAPPHPAMRGFTKEIGAINGSQSNPEQAANANLIVTLRNALPELIAALEVVKLVRDEDWLAEWIGDMMAMDWRPIDAARAIIAALPKETDNAHD